MKLNTLMHTFVCDLYYAIDGTKLTSSIENISKDIYFFSFLFKDENKIKDKTKIHKY